MARATENALELLAGLWRRLSGRLQWHLLWLLNAKFAVGVAGVILNDRGEVLLLRNRFWPAGSWGLPAGYARKREVLEQTLAREVEEETGYRIADVRLLDLISGYKLRLEAVFVARLAGGSLRLATGEVLAARFFPLDSPPAGLLATHAGFIRLARAARRPERGDRDG